MNITLYKVNSNPEIINKTLNEPITKSCKLKDSCSIENPLIELTYDSSILSKNYLYIPDFNRYYYITDKRIENHIIVLSCHVDVLKTYRNDILNSTGTATRSNFRNDLIRDPLILDIPKQTVEYRQLSAPLTGESYIMVVGG